MNIFNRVIIVVAALVILAGLVITTLVAANVTDPDVLFSGWFESQFKDVADLSGGAVAGVMAASIFIAFGIIFLLILELIPFRRPVLFLLSSSENGIAVIEKDSIRELAEHTAISFRNVRDATCKVVKNGEKLMVISCHASLPLGSIISEITAELQSKIKNTVEEHTGLKVRQVDVESKYESGQAKHLALR